MNSIVAPLEDDGLRAGFEDPVRDAQAAFRLILEAMSRPGTIVTLGLSIDPPAGLSRAAAAVCLAMADVDTPIHLDASANTPAVETFLKFHTGASITKDRDAALFGLCNGASARVSGLQLGTDEHPDRSATLIVQLDGIDVDGPLQLSGPGIKTVHSIGLAGLNANFFEARAGLAKVFPRGLDVIFVAGDRLAALPRTTVVDTSRSETR